MNVCMCEGLAVCSYDERMSYELRIVRCRSKKMKEHLRMKYECYKNVTQ